MQGINQIHLNCATMIEVVQQWIDTQMPLSTSTVTNVKMDSREMTFVVTLSCVSGNSLPYNPDIKV